MKHWPNRKVKELWDTGEFQRGCTEPWTARVVASLAEAMDARVILETGTFLGTTTAFLADALPRATVLSVDKSETPGRLPSTPNVIYIVADALEWIRKCSKHSIDFAFIDDDHDAQHVDRELEALRPAMVTGGIICLHDVSGPFKLDSVVAKHGGYCIELPRIHVAGGLGIIQV